MKTLQQQMTEWETRKQHQANSAAKSLASSRRAEMEAHPDYHRRKQMSRFNRQREAILQLAKNIHERNQWGVGDRASWDKAFSQAVAIAQRVETKKRLLGID